MFNKPDDIQFDNEFFEQCINANRGKEMEMENHKYIPNPEINFPITMNEIEIFICKSRLNKATGIDNLLNEVLKNQDVLIMLYTLFSKYFDMCLLPSV